MISYQRDSGETILTTAVKIIGLGGAGTNMLERIALDSIEGADLLALNSDIRRLGSCLAKEKIQLGATLMRGLGTGGDPELGLQAILEAETAVRSAIKDQRIVFICAGLGGGTGSGAAPIVARIAREEGAFVVIFATMPFFFEGRRRREQAETSLNQLTVLSNALITFDNNRMGELVLAKQGIHEAFGAADRMISESIKAVIRLVIRPGLINVGLDELMSALRTTRSRCLFGSGIAEGKDRAAKALRNALSSPLLEQGSLLKHAQTVLVHLSGGESLTLYEIELLMRSLQKYVPEAAHILFGAAIDPTMGDNLSITLISALPEDTLMSDARRSISPGMEHTPIIEKRSALPVIENPFIEFERETEPTIAEKLPQSETAFLDTTTTQESTENVTEDPLNEFLESQQRSKTISISDERSNKSHSVEPEISDLFPEVNHTESVPSLQEKEDRPYAEFFVTNNIPEPEILTEVPHSSSVAEAPPATHLPDKPTKGKSQLLHNAAFDANNAFDDEVMLPAAPTEKAPTTQLKLDPKFPSPQSELSFDNAPKGRFEGETPNVFDGEDLDLPPFLRKKKS